MAGPTGGGATPGVAVTRWRAVSSTDRRVGELLTGAPPGKTYPARGTGRRDCEMQVQQVKITPDPYEPFLLAQAHRVGDVLFVSGQAGIGAEGQIVGVGDFDRQAEQAFLNLDRVLRAGGSSLANVVKVTIFVTDMGNFDKVVELRRKWFTPPYPADTIAEVSSLYSLDALFEIEAVAVVDDAVERVDQA
jgi:2-iminobutanoate/2-iminopropanoate deaminase